MTIKRAILLGYSLHDFKTDLKEGDLISFTDGYDDRIYTLDKIDPRYGKRRDDPDTDFKYLVKGQYNIDQLVCYERSEISKAHIAFFDYYKYYKENKKILLGGISNEDLTYIKAKYANELEIPFSEFNTIKISDLIELDFYGSTINQELTTSKGISVFQYFKLEKPE